MTESQHQVKPSQSKHHKVVLRALGFSILMFGFGFALVPLYSVFCDWTGLNGKVPNRALEYAGGIDTSRTIKVQFLSSLGKDLDWDFYPLETSIEVHPGALTKVAFRAKNKTNKDMVAQAVPSISPGLTASYFRKTECFCFNEQKLVAGEAIEMPVVFAIDPHIPDEYHTITLSYTMYELTDRTQNNHQTKGRLPNP